MWLKVALRPNLVEQTDLFGKTQTTKQIKQQQQQQQQTNKQKQDKTNKYTLTKNKEIAITSRQKKDGLGMTHHGIHL